MVDDRPDFVKSAAIAVRNNTEIEPERVSGRELVNLVHKLVELQESTDDTSEFDDVDLFILDYDLRTEGNIGLTTGADIAKLLRSFTQCGAIVLTNAFPGSNREHRVDLRLVGDLDLMSDFEIGSEFLGNPGLWKSNDWPFFRIWSWPVLKDLHRRLTECSALLASSLDRPVCEVVPGLHDHLSNLSAEDAQWLGSNAASLTPRNIAGHGQFSMLAPAGGAPIPDRVVPRFAASRLMKWLDQFVLIRGISMVDEPHLISRQPEVLKDNVSLVGRNKWTDLLEPAIQKAATANSPWFSRTMWWTGDLKRAPVQDVLDKKPLVGLDEVFCEDASQFLKRTSSRSYRLPIPSAYGRRWLVDEQTYNDHFEDYQPDYQPEQWLLE